MRKWKSFLISKKNKEKTTSQKWCFLTPKQIILTIFISIKVDDIVPNQERLKEPNFSLLLQNKKI